MEATIVASPAAIAPLAAAAPQKSPAPAEAPSPSRKPHFLGDLLRDLNVGSVQKHVIGDEKLSRPYHRRARRRMHSRIAEVRLPCRICGDLGTNALKLAATDTLQILSLRDCRGRLVQINRNLVALPNLLANMPRHGHAIFDRHPLNRNERYHVRRAHPRMRSLMHVQINQLRRFANATDGGLLDWLTLADQRDDATIVVGIHLAIEQIDAVYLHGVNDRINLRFVAPLGKIWDTLHQSCWHIAEEYRVRLEPATSALRQKLENRGLSSRAYMNLDLKLQHKPDSR